MTHRPAARMRLRARVPALLLAGLFAGLAHADDRPGPEGFFAHPHMTGAALSPDGKTLAMTMATGTDKDAPLTLMALDLATMKATSLASFDDQDVAHVQWVNDHRLVFDMSDTDAAQGEVRRGWGLYGVNTDGTHLRLLVEQNGSWVRHGEDSIALPWNTRLLRPVDQRSEDVYVLKYDRYDDKSILHSQLQVLDTLRGKARDIDAPQHADGWIFDAKGQLRAVSTDEGARSRVLTRDVASDQWSVAGDFPSYGPADGFAPDFIDADGTLYVVSGKGSNTTAVWTYDLAAHQMSAQPFLQSKRYDLAPRYVVADGKLVGLRYEADAEVTTWLDPKYEALQAKVDKHLPNTVNRLDLAARGDGRFAVVLAYSDRLPGMWMLYDVREDKLSMLGNAMPDVDHRKMGTTEPVRYAARDGLEIPGYLTLPRGKERKNLPLVVMVHGGPFVRGREWHWDPEVQFLAARGYAVLEPEFRGSRGYGTALYKAGFKQWGLAMQDDLADGVKWAVAQGLVDPKRVCIAGASYGGYAVLMGLINDPEVYRCGVDWVGVTDINLMYTNDWSDASDDWKRYGMPVLIGDRVADAAQLKATSPIENAAKIHAPVLLAYGGKDRRVPLEHGERFRDALAKQPGAKFEWIVYDQEGHGWAKRENNVDFWSRVAKFLDANIGPAQ